MKKINFDEAPDIRNYVFTARETTSQEFKKKNEKIIEETLSELNTLYALKIACLRYGADFSASPRFDAFSIFTNPMAHGPHYCMSDDGEGIIGTISFPLSGQEEKIGQDMAVLTSISLVACIILRLFENALLEKSKLYEGWLQLPGTLHSYTCPTDKKINQLYKKFLKTPDFVHQRPETSQP